MFKGKILTVQDISCVGQCSLTVALPVISACGVETGVLPTAVLSNHTAFNNYTFCDLTSQISPISEVWQKEGITFDGIYTGYLGSTEQIDLVISLKKHLNEDGKFIVDPAMADNGKLYKGFEDSFPLSMAKLCAIADVIIPNITEACFLTGTKYQKSCDKEYIERLLDSLLSLGCKTAVLTGVSFKEGELGVAVRGQVGETYYYFNKKQPQMYHGTGDIYASVFTGALINGMSETQSASLAADFTAECVKKTIGDKNHTYGVHFEHILNKLTQKFCIE